MEGLIFLGVLILACFIAMEFHAIAEMKGFPEMKYFWFSFLFTIAGYLLVIALPDRKQREEQITASTDGQNKRIAGSESDELPEL